MAPKNLIILSEMHLRHLGGDENGVCYPGRSNIDVRNE